MIFTSGMMTHEESYVLRCLKNGTLCWTHGSVMRASVKVCQDTVPLFEHHGNGSLFEGPLLNFYLFLVA